MNHRRRLVAVVLFAAAGCRSAATGVGEGLWQPMPTPTTASLRALAVVDADVVWVGGTGGTLLRTQDGGRSWQDVRPAGAGDCDFRDLHAFDAEQAVVMVAGQPARLYRTTDGGRSWAIVHADERAAAFFDAIAFAGNDGVLFGDPIDGAFYLWRSQDRGGTWVPALPTLPPPVPGEAGFAASGTCAAIAAGDDGPPVVWLVTGGAIARCITCPSATRMATAAPLPLVQGAASQGAFAVAPRGGRLVAVGGDYLEPARSHGTAAWSDDGGVTWHDVPGGAGGYRSAVVWLDDDRLLAVGSHGASRSFDGGRSWQACGTLGFHRVAIGGDGSIWACGSDGRVARLDLRRFAAAPALPPR